MISKKFIGGLMILTLVFSMQSCSFLETLFKDQMMTTIDNVKPECLDQVVPADLGLMDAATKAKFESTGKVPVIVPRECVKDPTVNAVDFSNPGDDWIHDALGMGLSVAGTLVPGVAAFESLGLLLSRRKRKHYGKALKAVAPTNGKVEVKDAILSMASALGLSHSSKTTKDTFEEDEKKVEKVAT
jgi:hypothetical protein